VPVSAEDFEEEGEPEDPGRIEVVAEGVQALKKAWIGEAIMALIVDGFVVDTMVALGSAWNRRRRP
jgi:hypothetical protein